MLRQVGSQLLHVVWLDGRAPVIVEACSVSEQMVQGDGFWIVVFYLEGSQVLVHVGVQVEQTLFHQLHYSRGDEGLGDRADGYDGRFGVEGNLVFQLGQAIGFQRHYLAILHDDHSRSRYLQRGQLRREEVVQEGFEFARIDLNSLGSGRSFINLGPELGWMRRKGSGPRWRGCGTRIVALARLPVSLIACCAMQMAVAVGDRGT